MEWYFDNQVEDLVVPQDCDFTFNGSDNFYASVDMPLKYNNSSIYNNLASNDQENFQEFSDEINHMDDIYFNSLFEDDTSDDDATDRILDNIFESEIEYSQNDGTTKYLKTNDAFSPSTDWGNGELSTTYQIQKEYTRNENSMEESVLNDLERVTAQFTDKTRICFRDAFNRLAKSSKQSLNSCLDGESMMTSNDDTLRDQETEVGESETNVIDRAVGNLMFSNFNCEENDDQKAVSCCQHQRDHYNDDAIVPQLVLQDKFVMSYPLFRVNSC